MSLGKQYLDERFNSALATTPPFAPLPFFHTCDAKYLQYILDDKLLSPRECKVYSEKLLYLFYGKPGYKSANLKSSNYCFMMPVVFIINYDAISSIKRIVPFDSGGFNRYQAHFHESMTPNEFELTPVKPSLGKTVQFFYESNQHYFNGNAKKEVPFDRVHFQVEAYHSLITADYKADFDDRRSCLEVQLTSGIELNKHNIDTIILPTHLAESPAVKQILVHDLGINIITIPNYGIASSTYYALTLEKIKEYLAAKGLLNAIS